MSQHGSDDDDDTEVVEVERKGGGKEEKFTEGDKKLFVACENLDVVEVRRLLVSGEAVAGHEFYEEGTWGAHERASAVHKALRPNAAAGEAKDGRRVEQVLRLLLSHGASLSAKLESYDWRGCGRSESGTDMILKSGVVSLLRLAIEYKAFDPNQPTVSDAHTMRYDGRRVGYPLHGAVAKGDAEMVRLLLQAGANVDARQTNRGQSEYGDADDTSETALHVAVVSAARTRQSGEAVVRALLEGGADPNALKKWIDNVEVKVESKVEDPREDGYEPSVKNVRVVETPLMLAVRQKQPRLVAMLLMYGAHPGVQCTRDKDPLDLFGVLKDDPSPEARETMSVLSMNWTPYLYDLLPPAVKREVRCLLACINRSGLPPLPAPALGLLLASLIPRNLCQTPSEAFQELPVDRRFFHI